MINRSAILEKNSPTNDELDILSPFSVGNGSFCFTVDITGVQTLQTEYDVEGAFPLCTMSEWGWNSKPLKNGLLPEREDIHFTYYEMPYSHRIVKYPVKKFKDNEGIYDWFRKNPHKANLFRIRFLMNGEEITSAQIKNPIQKLNLQTGIIYSEFFLDGEIVVVETFVAENKNTIGVKVNSVLSIDIIIEFPNSNWNKNGSNWEEYEQYATSIKESNRSISIVNSLNTLSYYCQIKKSRKFNYIFNSLKHSLYCKNISKQSSYTFIMQTSNTQFNNDFIEEFLYYRELNIDYWEKYWTSIGFIEITNPIFPEKASELQRRIILSLYLTKIQATGNFPPAETGLSCNSWYGKFHLEMHFWHSAFLPLWNNSEDLKKSIRWYHNNLSKAQENAKINNFLGARWPKMVGNDGIDSPSEIAPLLIWQQTHIIFLLELIYSRNQTQEWLEDNFILVKETADFMCDFLVKDPKGAYILEPPIMPSQEVFNAEKVFNPTFELEYWRFCLEIAIQWAERLGFSYKKWEEVFNNLVSLDEKEDYYLAYEGCRKTYTEFNRDHPSFGGVYGLIGDHSRMNPIKVNRTLDKIMQTWNFEELWGWDFAMLSMTASRLGRFEEAIKILLLDTPKNQYLKNGNNFQKLTNNPKNYLPVYLPGNGSLLLGIATLIQELQKNNSENSFFEKTGWKLISENIFSLPN